MKIKFTKEECLRYAVVETETTPDFCLSSLLAEACVELEKVYYAEGVDIRKQYEVIASLRKALEADMLTKQHKEKL